MKKFILFVVSVFILSSCGYANVLGSGYSSSTPPLKVQTTVPVLMYHYVRDVDRSKDLLGWNLSVSPELFEKHMKYLADNDYVTINISDLLGGIVPENSIVLTFDDGTEDFYTNAFPILDKYGFTASNAVVSGFVGRDGYMNADQITEIIRGDVEILSHSVDHRNLVSLDDEALQLELENSRKSLEDAFHINVPGLVYPAGKYNNRVIEAAKKAGYEIALTTDYGMADLAKNDFMKLPRVRVDNRDGFDRFVKKMEEL